MQKILELQNINELRGLAARIGFGGRKIAQDLVAATSVEIRKSATPILERQFHFGERQTKLDQSTGKYTSSVFTRQSAQEWVSTSAKGKGGFKRMVNFNFENKRKSKDIFAQSRITSPMWNLWEEGSKPYSRFSPLFKRKGETSFAKWNKGESRPAKPTLKAIAATADSAYSRAIMRVNDNFEELMRKKKA